MSDQNQQTENNAVETVKQSSTILNIIMIILGIFFLAKGILEFFIWLNLIPAPLWLERIYNSLKGQDAANALAFLGPQGIVSATLGFWSLIAGILLFKEQESGWGMALVILSTITLIGISIIITWITVPGSLDFNYWPNWITILSVLIGFVGFIYLLFTKKRYS